MDREERPDWLPEPGPLTKKAEWMTRAIEAMAKRGTAKEQEARREMVGSHLPELRRDVAAMADRLTTEDAWLLAHPRHREHSPYEDAWLGRLWDYTAGYDAIRAAEKEVVG
ncbi:MAG: hypothetical protein WKF80_10240 [Thermomicrobiales bacterium]